jgi:hypothetical protein
MIMTGSLLGMVINLNIRLADKVIERLPEPLRSQTAGLRAEAAGCVKELAGLGMEILMGLNNSIEVSPAASGHEPNVKGNSSLRKIELE